MNPPVEWLSHKHPWFPLRAGHDRDPWELIVRVLRPVTTAHGLHEPDDLASSFKSSGIERTRNKKRDEGIRGNEHVRTRNERRHERTTPCLEELTKRLELSR